MSPSRVDSSFFSTCSVVHLKNNYHHRGAAFMGKQFASLKCYSVHVMNQSKERLPSCTLCGTVIENLFQSVDACLHHTNFQRQGTTTRSFSSTKYFATAFRNEKDLIQWFKNEEPLEILCKACHQLLHAVHLAEKKRVQDNDFNEWVKIYIKMVKLGSSMQSLLFGF